MKIRIKGEPPEKILEAELRNTANGVALTVQGYYIVTLTPEGLIVHSHVPEDFKLPLDPRRKSVKIINE